MHYAALMDNNASELSAAIGAKVRAERQAREWTLDQLAEQPGVSRRMLINVEQGTANPSVTTLLRISDALGIGLQALVAVPQTKPREGRPRAARRPRCGPAPAAVAACCWPAPRRRTCSSCGTGRSRPGDRHDSEAHVRGTKEILQVREGTVTVEVGDQTEVLEVGDAISFASDVAALLRQRGHRTGPVLPDRVRARRRRRHEDRGQP